MDYYFIDSSALAKVFITEAGTISVLSLIEGTEDKARLYAALTPVEVRSAVRRKERAGDVTNVEALGALQALAEEMRRTEQMPLTQNLLNVADEAIDHFALRAGDAMQLAAAMLFAELHSNDRLIFVASDEKLLAAAVAAQLTTVNPLTAGELPLRS